MLVSFKETVIRRLLKDKEFKEGLEKEIIDSILKEEYYTALTMLKDLVEYKERFRKMSEFKQYRRKSISEMRPYVEGEVLEGVSISEADLKAGSPKVGDMIARNPKNHEDQWLVAKAYFEDNLEPIE